MREAELFLENVDQRYRQAEKKRRRQDVACFGRELSGARKAFAASPVDPHDVQFRVPDVRKAHDVLGFEATTTLDAMLDEVIPWIRAELEAGRL